MQTAPIPKTLQDVRPLVRNMRPDGYILQTGGSATRQVITAEGDQVSPLFRVTGVPLHTHNASALLEVEVTMQTSTNLTKALSYAGEFSELDTTLAVGEHYQPEEDTDEVRNTFKARMQRSIDWGVGRVELRPENSVNYISEPTRVISEIRTLVSPLTSLEASTYISEERSYVTRAGLDVPRTETEHDIVMVPVLPVNNWHIESKLAQHRQLVQGHQRLHLEVWPETMPDAIFEAATPGLPYNDWRVRSESWSRRMDAQQVPVGIPYPVALLPIGRDANLYEVSSTGEVVPSDGRIAYRFEAKSNTYVPDVTKEFVFKSLGDGDCIFGSNGHLRPNLKDNGSGAEQATFNTLDNPGNEVRFRISTDKLAPAIQKDGFWYIGSGQFEWDLDVGTDRKALRANRMLVIGKFTSDPIDAHFRPNGQGYVYKNVFYNRECAWHAPVVRWPVGSSPDTGLSGPLTAIMNLDAVANSTDQERFPSTGTRNRWSSAFETEARRNLSHRPGPVTMTSSGTLPALFRGLPSHHTFVEEKQDGTQGADNVAFTNAQWGLAQAVPFQAGLHPFPDDTRFEHQAAVHVATNLDHVDTHVDAEVLKANESSLWVENAGDFIKRKGAVGFGKALIVGEQSTGATVTNTLLELLGARGVGAFSTAESRTSVLSRVHRPYGNIPSFADDAYYDALDRGFSSRLQACASLCWMSEFIGAGPTTYTCPCMYISRDVSIDDYTNAHDGAEPIVWTTVLIDQEPFYRVGFDASSGLSYRGGFAKHTVRQAAGGLTAGATTVEPQIGNCFAYGPTVANGGSADMRDGQLCAMTVTITPTSAGASTGIMRVSGLAFDPSIDQRTLLIYYGDGGGQDREKQLFISDPGTRTTSIHLAPMTGAAGMKQGVWTTDISVRSPAVIATVATRVVADDEDGSHLFLIVVAPKAQPLCDGSGEIGTRVALSRVKGNVFAPKYTVTQYLAAPVVCSDFRSDCIEPLDQTSPFLPPEMRDFRLTLRDIDWRHVPEQMSVEVKRLLFSEFNGGNQQVAAIPSLLSVPEFRVTRSLETGASFDMEVYTPMGPPAFWAVFARRPERPNYGQQPIVETLSMFCLTTGKKSDTIQDTSAADLYFITQRNVHNLSGYNADRFRERQVVLMRSEDVGTMGISPRLFQREKRTRFRVQGTLSLQSATTEVFVVLVYNNRGLQIMGKEISVQYL